ncbi:hypothetical protein C8R47DRAFT_1075735 [Mycena vitilis]|nr:hypothetical protein C8R47DRAFT_1075735 [Mycena vitilis]
MCILPGGLWARRCLPSVSRACRTGGSGMFDPTVEIDHRGARVAHAPRLQYHYFQSSIHAIASQYAVTGINLLTRKPDPHPYYCVGARHLFSGSELSTCTRPLAQASHTGTIGYLMPQIPTKAVSSAPSSVRCAICEDVNIGLQAKGIGIRTVTYGYGHTYAGLGQAGNVNGITRQTFVISSLHILPQNSVSYPQSHPACVPRRKEDQNCIKNLQTLECASSLKAHKPIEAILQAKLTYTSHFVTPKPVCRKPTPCSIHAWLRATGELNCNIPTAIGLPDTITVLPMIIQC